MSMEINSSINITRPEQAPKRPKTELVGKPNSPSSEAAGEVARAGGLKSTQDESVLFQARQFRQQSGYDQPDKRGNQAITEYLSLERESRRDSIREMLGVDLFA